MVTSGGETDVLKSLFAKMFGSDLATAAGVADECHGGVLGH